MRTLGSRIGASTASVNLEHIKQVLNESEFYEMNTDELKSLAFFMEFKEMYNGIPVFSKYTVKHVEKLQQCFDWLGYEVLKNGNVFEYKPYRINAVIYSLLTNASLESIKTIDGEIEFAIFIDQYKEASNFEKINFTEVSPYTLDGELTEIALSGSVYCKWKYGTIETKLMATEFVNTIIEGRFDDFKIYRTQESWGGSYLGFFIAYFLFDRKKGEFWILSKDDYD